MGQAWQGLYRGILVMGDWLILFSVKCEFRKLIFIDPWPQGFAWPIKNWIFHWYLWFHHSVLWDFKMQVLQMIGVVYQGWLGQVVCNMAWLSLSWFFFLQTLVCDLGKWNCCITDPQYFFLFMNHTIDSHAGLSGKYFQLKALLGSYMYSACRTCNI